MTKDILRVRLTHNVRQLKKYVDEAIEKGADAIHFNMDKENPYFIFTADLTPEEENEYKINELKKDFQKQIKTLEGNKFKTHSFRITQYGASGAYIDGLVKTFKEENNIKESFYYVKQVINDDYDDFDDELQTVFVTEIL
jgi:MoaA/NifB/PqqE/SkfB family radical SAM enzyme